MKSGVVKWFNNAKGYGFINEVGVSDVDIFVHFSIIKMDGYKTLKTNQAVLFESYEAENGMHASVVEMSEVISVGSSRNDVNSK